MTEETKSGISRRTLAKGAAWSVPAVAVAAAAPAYAKSSGGPTVTVLSACKQPGNSCNTGNRPFGFVKGYTFTVALYNPTGETIYVYTSQPSTPPGPYHPRFQVTSAVPFSYTTARYFTPGQVPPGSGIGAPVGAYVTLTPGQTVYLIINAGANDNSANQSASGSLFFAWGHTTTAGADAEHSYTPVPPPLATAGEGWVGDSFTFPDMPPCDDCVPGVPTTTTTTTVALRRAAETETTTQAPVKTETTTQAVIETETTTQAVIETETTTEAPVQTETTTQG
ncbi:hypothetical protein ET989_03630 [Propioniciclava sinopodophylli]|uniref:DUF4232 domain-containing protein n=1 Tax=Propioniciclava sinopodophylli TaxID=1837344 RepID=A0A4Q9KG49_9ACTN|nr:hypothetical protein [Propioniciclava sinopodophylli]TBT87408.1 hypothetical protein ET989_03630 [Propioniciclava sinopodophylli]